MSLRSPSEEPVVGPDPHRTETDVKIGEADREEAQPRKELMLVVERARTGVGHIAHAMLADLVMRSADKMPHRMAAERVGAEEADVDEQNDGADADPELHAAVAIGPPERLPGVVGKQHDEDAGEIEEVAVNVLQDQRERVLAPVAFARLANGAR